MSNWKVHTEFATTGPQALVGEKVRLIIEKNTGEMPAYLTIDAYPDRAPKYPQRHFGIWQFRFSDIAEAREIVLTLGKDGAALTADGRAIEPCSVIDGPLREDGLYTVYVVLAAKETYAEIDKARYSRLISFSGASLDMVEHWPGRARRAPTDLQPECWMMRRLAEEIEKFAASLAPGALVLDFGGGEAEYFPFFAQNGAQYRNAEIYPGQLVDIVCEESGKLPVEDATYDAIICIHVLEHTPDPWRVVAELHRVLKPGGRILAGMPFAWEHHREPDDYWRFGKNGVEKLFENFSALDIKTDANTEQAFIMLKNTYYYNAIKNAFLRDFMVRRGNRKYLKAAKCTDYSFSCNYIVTATKKHEK